jgi:hypothetical protein
MPTHPDDLDTHYKCKDCGDVDLVYVECVHITWNPQYQDWDIDPNDKASNQRCSGCHSWNIEEYKEIK